MPLIRYDENDPRPTIRLNGMIVDVRKWTVCEDSLDSRDFRTPPDVIERSITVVGTIPDQIIRMVDGDGVAITSDAKRIRISLEWDTEEKYEPPAELPPPEPIADRIRRLAEDPDTTDIELRDAIFEAAENIEQIESEDVECPE